MDHGTSGQTPSTLQRIRWEGMHNACSRVCATWRLATATATRKSRIKMALNEPIIHRWRLQQTSSVYTLQGVWPAVGTWLPTGTGAAAMKRSAEWLAQALCTQSSETRALACQRFRTSQPFGTLLCRCGSALVLPLSAQSLSTPRLVGHIPKPQAVEPARPPAARRLASHEDQEE